MVWLIEMEAVRHAEYLFIFPPTFKIANLDVVKHNFSASVKCFLTSKKHNTFVADSIEKIAIDQIAKFHVDNNHFLLRTLMLILSYKTSIRVSICCIVFLNITTL